MFFNLFKKNKKKETPQEVQYTFEQMLETLNKRMADLQKDAIDKIQEIDHSFEILRENTKKEGEKYLNLENLVYFFPESIDKLGWEKLQNHIVKIGRDLRNILNTFLEAFAHIKAMKIRYDNSLAIYKNEKTYSLKKIKSAQEKIESKKMRKYDGIELIRSMEKRALIAEKEIEILEKQCADIQLHYEYYDKIVSTLKKHKSLLMLKQIMLNHEHQLNQTIIKYFQDFINQDTALKTKEAFDALEKRIEAEKQELERLKAGILREMGL